MLVYLCFHSFPHDLGSLLGVGSQNGAPSVLRGPASDVLKLVHTSWGKLMASKDSSTPGTHTLMEFVFVERGLVLATQF